MWRGHSVEGDATPVIGEYFQRQTLSKIGYRFDASELNSFKAECFGIIANQLSVLENQENTKAAQKSKRR